MSDASETGHVIGDHWVLVIAIGSGVVALGFLVKVIFMSLQFGRKLLQDEIHEGLIISLSNGMGKKVEELVRSGVATALAQHFSDCPGRDRVNAQHERILALEKALLDAASKGKKKNEDDD